MTDSAKIQWLYDREQIKEAVYLYPVSIDAHDWKLFRSIFTDEIDILLTAAARADRPRQKVAADEFARMVESVITSFSVTQHLLTDYHIEVKGDDATCFCYMQARHFPPRDKPNQQIWDMGGHYTFHLKRTADGWKIPRYTLIMTWETGRPSDLKIDL